MMTDQIEHVPKVLTEQEQQNLTNQNTRLVPEHKAESLELNARKHWDLFYKRNENRFFKDRHWTTREFEELLDENETKTNSRKTLLEIGCGVGNFVFPLIESKLNYYVYACDFSARAVGLVKSNPLYDESLINAFQCDITNDFNFIDPVIAINSVDVVTLIFVLSAIHPDKFRNVVRNVHSVLKPGGIVLLRDYGLYDMAQLRFKPGHKIGENFYMRQDGTRSYYFSTEKIAELFTIDNEFQVISNGYVHRRTVNKKEGIDVPRIFVQAKFQKADTT